MTYETIILTAAKAAKVSGALLLAICTHESGLSNTFVSNDGGSATFGICQVKVETAKMMGFKGKDTDLMVPKINAKYASLYVKYQYERYGDNWVKIASAYNSGTYKESKKVPGCPRNLKYIKNVQKKLPADLRYRMSCGTTKSSG